MIDYFELVSLQILGCSIAHTTCNDSSILVVSRRLPFLAEKQETSVCLKLFGVVLVGIRA